MIKFEENVDQIFFIYAPNSFTYCYHSVFVIKVITWRGTTSTVFHFKIKHFIQSTSGDTDSDSSRFSKTTPSWKAETETQLGSASPKRSGQKLRKSTNGGWNKLSKEITRVLVQWLTSCQVSLFFILFVYFRKISVLQKSLSAQK